MDGQLSAQPPSVTPTVMNAELITIGTELLLGQIVDSNAAWIAQQLAAEGVNLFRKTTVGDNRQRVCRRDPRGTGAGGCSDYDRGTRSDRR